MRGSPQAIRKRFLPLLTVLLVFFTGCVTDRALREGLQYSSQGEWDKSVRFFQEAHQKDPDDQEVKLLLYRSKRNASLLHMEKGGFLLEKGRFDEAIKEFQISIAFDPGNLRAETAIEKARALKEADHYIKKGENLAKARKYAQAREAFLKARELHPESEKARKALSLYKKQGERPPFSQVKVDRDTPVSLKFKNTPILNVFEVLTRITGVNFVFDKDVQDTKVTVFVTDVSFDEFLGIFLRTNKLAAKVVNEKTLVVYPDLPNKAKEYQDLQIRTFYLAHMDVTKAVALLSKILKSKDIIANDELNALVIRGPEHLIDVASKVIEANDRSPSEVMLNVEILEVSRTKEKSLGIELDPASVSVDLGEGTTEFTEASDIATGTGSLYALERISTKNLLFSLPTATLNLLKQDGDTKTLANPQIRVKSANKATIHIGERVPLRTNRRVDSEGTVTYDFQYQDVGVKLEVEPTINIHEEITLDLSLEVSTLGQNLGTTDDPQYAIGTRTAKSVLTVRPGETVIIGGLISDEERRTLRKIPLLGELPALGHLFSNYNTDDSKTDILMALTPIIARGQEIPGPDVAEIWSGRENDFSLREPFESALDHQQEYLDRPAEDISPADKEAALRQLPAPEPIPGPLEDAGPSFPPEDDFLRPFEAGPPTLEEPLPPRASPEDAARELSTDPIRAPQRTLEKETPAPGEGPPEPEDPQISSPLENWPPSLPFTVHVNSYLSEEEARKRIQELKEKDYDCFKISRFVPVKNRVFHRIFVGKFRRYAAAMKSCQTLKGMEGFRADIHVADRDWALGN